MSRDHHPELCRYQCWKCGADLKSVPRPFSRFAECPQCKTELHVCRMCRHHNPRYVGECDHEFADKVLEKEKANFCSHFKPSPRAFEGAGNPEKEKAQQQLRSLFEEHGGTDERVEPDVSESRAEDDAKKRLKDLFGE